MNYSVTYPLTTHPYNPEFTTKAGLTRFCQVAEAAGFAGIGFTDHPAPTHKWLQAGGHDASTRSPHSRSVPPSPTGFA